MASSKRGFASMDKEKQRRIASLGGQAAHQKGLAHEFTPEEAREAGRKGGAAVSRNREHMASIGQKGGATVSRDRRHMANIGQKGAESPGRGNNAGVSE
jgi:general stress protein YciG